MKNLLQITFLFAVVLGFGALTASAQNVGGGYKSVDKTEAGVVAAAEFAVGEQAERSETTVTLVEVKTAERQVVAGTNYRLCLQIETDDEVKQVKAVVFLSLKQVFSLTSWTEENCSGDEDSQ